MSELPGSGRTVLLVTGAGRSGTSTVAGALKHLGLRIPGPEIPPDDSNPRGFFEPRWVVARHMALMNRAEAMDLDADPAAGKVIASVTNNSYFRRELREWLAELPPESDTFVIKEPRTVWFLPTWRKLLEEQGFRVVFLSMLRNPVEVVQSRGAYYHASADAARAATARARQLAGWVNVNLINELHTRNADRIFVPYAGLLADWRAEMRKVRDTLNVSFNHDLGASHHENDDFIDAKLNRVAASWDSAPVQPVLRELADGVWKSLNGNVAADDLDAFMTAYADHYTLSAALVEDQIRRRVRKRLAEYKEQRA